MNIEHGKGVYHRGSTQVQDFAVAAIGVNDAFVHVWIVKQIGATATQIVGHKRMMSQISSAENDSVEIPLRTIGKVYCTFVHFSHDWSLRDVGRPWVTGGLGAIGQDSFFRSVFDGLGCNILSGITRTNLIKKKCIQKIHFPSQENQKLPRELFAPQTLLHS